MADLTRSEAWELLTKYTKEPFHLRHALTVEGIMKYFAKELGYADETGFWAQVGLLHDLLPAFQKTLALLFHQLWNQRPCLCGQGAQFDHTLTEALSEFFAFALTRMHQLIKRFLRQLQDLLLHIFQRSGMLCQT